MLTTVSMLNAILGHIDRVYDLELDVDIHDFLLSDDGLRDARSRPGSTVRARP